MGGMADKITKRKLQRRYEERKEGSGGEKRKTRTKKRRQKKKEEDGSEIQYLTCYVDQFYLLAYFLFVSMYKGGVTLLFLLTP